MNFWFVLICSLLTRGIDTACSVYGFGYLARFWWGWIILGVGILFLLTMTYLLWLYDKKRKERESALENNAEQENL